MRKFWTLTHRYVGLAMALFLVIAGITGSLLVWYEDLDRAVWPVLRHVAPPSAQAQPLDNFELRERVLATVPGATGDFLQFDGEPGAPVSFGLEDAAGNDELFVDPFTGAELGCREWGNILQGSKNLLPFIYRLHYTLCARYGGCVCVRDCGLVVDAGLFCRVLFDVSASKKSPSPPAPLPHAGEGGR